MHTHLQDTCKPICAYQICLRGGLVLDSRQKLRNIKQDDSGMKQSRNVGAQNRESEDSRTDGQFQGIKWQN
jgi:hypothetical protein